ncbi:histidine kinase [Dactylosporangium sp. AC04546]|uniref:sensor histidine kinase n=1 Tax=Dactylosporangium sp. AC04546 TaxID=2862460 RepID=UPI001EDF0B82|nr:ATP-binding protein [Dactylosporangium sp. AC04546]WVK78714.1 histidine kinase [Dactylosporangium sp. AC04546]
MPATWFWSVAAMSVVFAFVALAVVLYAVVSVRGMHMAGSGWLWLALGAVQLGLLGYLLWALPRLRAAGRAVAGPGAGAPGARAVRPPPAASDRLIAQRLQSARAEERERLRQDLHDGIGPALAGTQLRLETAVGILHEPRGRQLVLEAVDTTAAIAEEVRRVLADLHPSGLGDADLSTALRGLGQLLGCGDTDVVVDVPAAPLNVSPVTEVVAYRIAGEALTNALRHSGARRVTVRLTAHADLVLLRLLDDGIGPPATVRSGVGLTSMRRRAASIGGRCRVGPRRGGGTEVRVELPRWPA